MEVSNQMTDKQRQLQSGQGLVEYSLLITFVALVCVSILVVLGRTTSSSIQKVNCAVGSPEPQCGCINEKLTVTGACTGNNLAVTISSTCASTTLRVNGTNKTNPGSFTWNSAPVCTGGATSFVVQSTQPDGTVKSYNASKP